MSQFPDEITHAHPSVIMDRLNVLQKSAAKVTATMSTILGCLSTALDLPAGSGFESYHPPEADSLSMP